MENSLLYKTQNFTSIDVDEVVKFIEEINEKPLLIRKICFLTVEILQNIIHHSDKNENGNTFAYYELIKESNTYIIKSGNLISKEHTEEFEKQLQSVTGSTDEEIKEKINHKLKNEDFTDKGGSGIGLLSIKKRVGEGMNYEIEHFIGNYDMIHFEIKI